MTIADATRAHFKQINPFIVAATYFNADGLGCWAENLTVETARLRIAALTERGVAVEIERKTTR